MSDLRCEVIALAALDLRNDSSYCEGYLDALKSDSETGMRNSIEVRQAPNLYRSVNQN